MNEFIEIPATQRSFSMRRPVEGIGVNDVQYQVKNTRDNTMCPYYILWRNMLVRCYNREKQIIDPTYIGCSVCDNWLYFSKFKQWMILQDWIGNELDKDVINPGNKIYSPENCAFVTKEVNTILNSHSNNRGAFPQGVSLYKATGRFQAKCSINNIRKHLGYFNTAEQAHDVYKKFKSKVIRTLSLKQSNPLVANGLIKHADLLANGVVV